MIPLDLTPYVFNACEQLRMMMLIRRGDMPNAENFEVIINSVCGTIDCTVSLDINPSFPGILIELSDRI